MIITWNGVYNRIGELFIGKRAYEIYTNHLERYSLIYSPITGIVFQADWEDDRWKTLLNSRRKKDLLKVLKEYATDK